MRGLALEAEKMAFPAVNTANPYSENGAMFPLCTFCFRNLPTEKIITYACAVAESWFRPGDILHNGMTKDAIQNNVSRAIRYLKIETEIPPSQTFLTSPRMCMVEGAKEVYELSPSAKEGDKCPKTDGGVLVLSSH